MRTSGLTVLALLGLLTGAVPALRAQDQRNVPEPPFPATCAVVHAPLRSSGEGPIVGSTAAEQDAESATEMGLIEDGFHKCAGRSGQAVELTLGHDSSYNAFLLDPVTLPQGVSLIIDGGVTVFASRDPRNYQDTTTTVQCGTYGPEPPYGVNVGCIPFLTLAADSGIYGYGVIDAQGDKHLIFYPPFDSTVTAPAEPFNWWALTSQKSGCVTASPDENCEQSSPLVISAGNIPGANSPNDNLTLYKITIRNPPFHTVSLGGTNVTVWGVKVQAPWNLPNTDGFDIHASNVTVYDTTVANGDQEIAFGSNGTTPSQHITVDHFHGYSKGGITILGSGDATSNLLVQNVDISGDLPSVVIRKVPGRSEVNGMSEKEMQKRYGIQSYGQALPNATNDLKALQITDSSQNNTSKPGSNISDVVFKSVCIQDIVKPLNVTFSASDQTPTVKGLVLQDIHVLAPTAQFPEMSKGIPDGNPGSYQLSFVTQPTATPNQFTLDNVVFDDQAPTVSSISSIDAEVNTITTSTNVYPSLLNQLTWGSPKKTQSGPPKLTLLSNTYTSATGVSNPALAHACGTGQMPFIVGDLYVSVGSKTGDWTNLQSAGVKAGSSVTLNAVIQPIMSQTTHFISGSYGATPGLLAVGSPALRNPVIFYEGWRPIGFGILSANGTLATLVVKNISAGTHTYTAQYPADRFYSNLNFGSVTVQAAR
jgi:hypothetical protein